MADQASKDTAAQNRIITHMNADHHDSIIRYLENHANLSAWTASTGRLSAIALDSLTLTCNGTRHRIPLNPPMASYAEARTRLVELDAECIKALNRSPITVNEYVPPQGPAGIAMFAITLSTFLGYSQKWWFEANGPVAGVLGEGFAAFSRAIQPWVFWGMVGIHGAELVYFVFGKLGKHSVNPKTVTYWLWIVGTFIEGQFSYMRFDGLVERKRLAKAKAKH